MKTRRRKTDIVVNDTIPRLNVFSPSFKNMEAIPLRHTSRGDNISPPLELSGFVEKAVTIAIILDDLDVPWKANFTHWVIWNIPVVNHIPEGLPAGKLKAELSGAMQGLAYGRNQYKGPLPPFGTHRYQFHVFVLDIKLALNSSCGKSDLITAMNGHILQYGSLTGWYPRKAY